MGKLMNWLVFYHQVLQIGWLQELLGLHDIELAGIWFPDVLFVVIVLGRQHPVLATGESKKKSQLSIALIPSTLLKFQ